jgi:DNA polymerase III epsilon subunit-like protein
MSNLLRYKSDQKYLVVDCESCHLNLAIDNLAWQWGGLTATGEQITSEFEHYLKWHGIKVSEGAARVTRFSYHELEQKGEDPKKIMTKLDELLYNPDYLILMANGLRFDVYVHNQCRKTLGLCTDYSYLERIIDPVALMKAYKLDIAIPKDISLLQFQYKLHNIVKKGLKTSVKAMCKDLEVAYNEELAHGALYDSKLLFSIWNKLKWKIEI